MTTPNLAKHALLAKQSVQSVLQALNAVKPDCARLVGGCVRDAILRRTAGDIDIATQLTPDAVIAACAEAGIKTVPTGIDHGTITAVVDSKPVEITTLRKDVETDGRYAVVSFTEDWLQDAQRRDLTMNSLYCDAQGTVFDPTGHGVADVLAGRVAFVGDPNLRVCEDFLRILRFFRFSAWYGKGELDRTALAACAEHAQQIATLSVERVWSELKKLLAAPDPSQALTAMAASGVLAVALPESNGTKFLQQLLDIENSLFLEPDPMQRLMALLPRQPDAIATVASRLKLSTAERTRLELWAEDNSRIVSYLSAREVRAALYWMGHELYLDRVRLEWASDGEPRRASQWRAMIAFANGFLAPKFPIDGQQVLAAGARPGPAIGQILREVERWWVENDFIEDELSLIERLKAVVQGLG